MTIRSEIIGNSIRIRKIITAYYPFDTAATYRIGQLDLRAFVRYIPIAEIDVEDVVFARDFVQGKIDVYND